MRLPCPSNPVPNSKRELGSRLFHIEHQCMEPRSQEREGAHLKISNLNPIDIN